MMMLQSVGSQTLLVPIIKPTIQRWHGIMPVALCIASLCHAVLYLRGPCTFGNICTNLFPRRNIWSRNLRPLYSKPLLPGWSPLVWTPSIESYWSKPLVGNPSTGATTWWATLQLNSFDESQPILITSLNAASPFWGRLEQVPHARVPL